MNNNQQNPIFDGKLILTIVVITVFWIAYQTHLAKKYPKTDTTVTASNPTPGVTAPMEAEVSGTKPSTEKKSDGIASLQRNKITTENTPEKTLTYKGNLFGFTISSYGLGVNNFDLKGYKGRTGEEIVLAGNDGYVLFQTLFSGQSTPIIFDLTQTGEKEFTGIYLNDGVKVTKIVQVDDANYSLRTKIRVEGAGSNFTGLVTKSVEKILPQTGGMFFMPSFDHQEFFVINDDSHKRSVISLKENFSEVYTKVKIAAFGSQYFASAIVDKSPVMPEYRATSVISEEKTYGLLTHNVLNKSSDFAVEYVAFAGPKSADVLKTIDPELTDLVNFGFFASIAKTLHWLLRTIHAAIGNWGVAIILLTLLIRVLVMPFNLMSYKSMKAMTTIQPQMKIIRERYKNDPNTMNQEVMKLMKESKANPLGGCLPMFLQIPIFFALYQVIGQSIELYQAPFAFWIHDLSLKDPFYVLPVLMGITMFLQQKITPSTMEPAQQKIMMVLPFVFSLMMIALPSALTLYLSVSTLFGVVQQYFFMKSNNMKVPTIEVSA